MIWNWTLLGAAVLIFMIIMLILVALLLFVKIRLTPAGKVKIDINKGEKILNVNPGSSLLSTLADEEIFLPSGCGGSGTCGLCKCQVLSGAGTILPTETGFFTRKQQQDNWRLGCQVKVRENLEILIPQTILGIRKLECEVISNKCVATFIKEFVIRLPEGENLNFRSGGYIQIYIPEYRIDYKEIDIDEKYRADWEKMKIFDLHAKNTEPTFRAYSMANQPAESNIIMLNVRIATPPFDKAKCRFMNVNPGISSTYIFDRKPGDKVTISGPYGEFFLKEETGNEIVFIGGGAGMAPMRSHIFHLFKTLKTDRKVSFWYGARSRKEIFYESDFEEIEKEFPNFKFHIALSEALPEDNWTGCTGFIHQVLYDNYLKDHEAPEDLEYYLCGPPLMTSSAIKMLDSIGVPAENIMYDDFGE